ncbi:hypothetical protein SEA_FIZZLES_67 [Microbacterium phage Fizzles]|nr:hypothetical protein SEA_FIZZLES_67 [Microbacterium phage Fizzles]
MTRRDWAEAGIVLTIIAVSFACGVAATYFGMLWTGGLA